jgi:cytochrome c-type biogenesis protein CcsB
MALLKRFYNLLSSMQLAVILLSIFAIAVGVATFIENDFGTETAQAEIYRARWFEVLLFLGTLNLLLVWLKYKMYRFKKWYISLFHLSFIVVMLGAFVTRYFGFEGTMHIREDMSSNSILSEKSYIDVSVDGETISTPYQFSNLRENRFSVEVGGLQISLKEYLPYIKRERVESENGKASLSAVVSIDEELEPLQIEISEGDFIDLGFVVLDFGAGYRSETLHEQKVIKIEREGESIQMVWKDGISTLSMATQEEKNLGERGEVQKRFLYRVGGISLVFKDISMGMEERVVSKMDLSKNERENLPSLFTFQIESENEEKELEVSGMAGAIGKEYSTKVGNRVVSISYGAKEIELPFSIYLRDFQLERYPGSMSPSSYASEVTLNDGDLKEDYRIFMNHVLDHRGYRFFQSSYDTDERGTILSVNYDPGTPVTYLAYFIMFLGMFATLFGSKSRFQKLRRELGKSAVTVVTLIALALPNSGFSEKIEVESIDTLFKFDKNHADNFGTLLVQSNGRMKPLDSLNMEIIRKISRQESIEGLNHNQIVLGMVLKPALWKQINMIYTKDEKINEILGVPADQKRVPFELFFDDPDMLAGYKLSPYISKALQTPPKKRGMFEKNILKIDERVNVAYMVYSGQILKIYPSPEAGSDKWFSTIDAIQNFPTKDAEIVRTLTILYFGSIDKALKDGDWSSPDSNLEHIRKFQEGHGKGIYLERDRIDAEILYNKANIFQNLIPYTFGIGLLLLVLSFWKLVSERTFRTPLFILKSGIYLIFILYTTGLALRWYISGHAPWSDAYESLIYIGWATLLAGIIFSKTSPFTLSATAILSGIILFVAHLSWLDPQITNLVPVLKSYWLTIHVSMITASYGFLGLGALLGFITLLLFATKREKNRERFEKNILDLNRVNEMNLIIGLVLLTVGNFLGGVWANESWGRYWGWDPKETWALVTILVYAVVLHLRFIPKMNSQYLFSLISLLAFSSVLMTYFGVNFYLSGMHSYAQGDPVPVPEFVYWTLGTIFVVALLAWRKREIR